MILNISYGQWTLILQEYFNLPTTNLLWLYYSIFKYSNADF